LLVKVKGQCLEPYTFSSQGAAKGREALYVTLAIEDPGDSRWRQEVLRIHGSGLGTKEATHGSQDTMLCIQLGAAGQVHGLLCPLDSIGGPPSDFSPLSCPEVTEGLGLVKVRMIPREGTHEPWPNSHSI
jgi:hypothetical protein